MPDLADTLSQALHGSVDHETLDPAVIRSAAARVRRHGHRRQIGATIAVTAVVAGTGAAVAIGLAGHDGDDAVLRPAKKPVAPLSVHQQLVREHCTQPAPNAILGPSVTVADPQLRDITLQLPSTRFNVALKTTPDTYAKSHNGALATSSYEPVTSAATVPSYTTSLGLCRNRNTADKRWNLSTTTMNDHPIGQSKHNAGQSLSVDVSLRSPLHGFRWRNADGTYGLSHDTFDRYVDVHGVQAWLMRPVNGDGIGNSELLDLYVGKYLVTVFANSTTIAHGHYIEHPQVPLGTLTTFADALTNLPYKHASK